MGFDSLSNLYVTGTYFSDFDIDPGPGLTMLPTPNNTSKSFVAKFSPSNQLINHWAFANPSNSSTFHIFDMEISVNNGFYITGEFSGTMDFDLGSGSSLLSASPPGESSFIAKYDSTGALLWVNELMNDNNSQGLLLGVTQSDDVIAIGGFTGYLVFPLVTNDTTFFDWSGISTYFSLYMVKYNSSGGAIWANHLPSVGQSKFQSIDLSNKDSTFFVSFSFSEDVVLELDNSNFQLSSSSSPKPDMGVAKYNTEDGSFDYGFSLPNSYYNYCYVDTREDTLYILGQFENTIDTDPSVLTHNLTTSNYISLFLGKYPPCQTSTLVLHDTICQGDSVFLEGVFQTNTGIYRDTFQTIIGCDSIHVTVLEVLPSYIFTTMSSICYGDSLLIYGVYQYASGIYYDSLQTINGCDSIFSTSLTVSNGNVTYQNISICSGDSVLLGGGYQTTNGVYIDSIPNSSWM